MCISTMYFKGKLRAREKWIGDKTELVVLSLSAAKELDGLTLLLGYIARHTVRSKA